jgi:hypothetical protein
MGKPRSYCHLFCSRKTAHAGTRGQNDSRVKCYLKQFPAGIDLVS